MLNLCHCDVGNVFPFKPFSSVFLCAKKHPSQLNNKHDENYFASHCDSCVNSREKCSLINGFRSENEMMNGFLGRGDVLREKEITNDGAVNFSRSPLKKAPA